MKHKIVYIATRESSYSRVAIVRDGLRAHFEVDEILSDRKRYPLRLAVIALHLLVAWITGRLRRADAVVVGFFAQPIFPLVRWCYRGPIIADAYFSIYDTMVFDKGKTRPGSWLARLCFWLDCTMLRRSQLCFTDTLQHVQYLKSAFDAPAAQVSRLWISAQQQRLPSVAADPQPGAPFQVLFWGGFIPLQGVETIVRAAARLRNDNVRFTLIGAGQTFEKCTRLQSKLGADNLSFDGWKSLEEIQAAAAKSHLALGIFGTTDKAARVIPNKAFEALAMGLPLITRHSPAVDELLRDHHDVMLVEAGNPQQLAEKILWAREHYEEVRQIAQRGHETFQQRAAPRVVAESVHQAVKQLLTPTQPVPPDNAAGHDNVHSPVATPAITVIDAPSPQAGQEV